VAFPTRNADCRPQEQLALLVRERLPQADAASPFAAKPIPILLRRAYAAVPDVRTRRSRNRKTVNNPLLRLAACHGKGEADWAGSRYFRSPRGSARLLLKFQLTETLVMG